MSSNHLVNIEGLPKDKVLLALYKNVRHKSFEYFSRQKFLSEGYQFLFNDDKYIFDFVFNAEKEVKHALSENKKITYVGPVLFFVDFSGNTINTAIYDKAHETHEEDHNMMDARACIDQLKDEIELQNSELSKEEKVRLKNGELIKIFKEKNLLWKFNESKDKVDIGVSQEEGSCLKVNNLIKILLSKEDCRIQRNYTFEDSYSLVFNTSQTLAFLQQCAEKLKQAGIKVKIREKDITGDFFAVPKLEICETLEALSTKLSTFYFKPEPIGCNKIKIL